MSDEQGDAALARNAYVAEYERRVRAEAAAERLRGELQALVDWFNDAPFLRAERLLYDLSREAHGQAPSKRDEPE